MPAPRPRPLRALRAALPAIACLLPWATDAAGQGTPGPGGHEARPPRAAPVLEPASGTPRRAAAQDQPGERRFRPAPATLVREGAMLRNRRGRLVQAEGAWFFVFDRDAQGQAEPPMVVLPCLRLREMQRLMETRRHTTTFQITGQVFVYDDRNYLLPTFFTSAAEAAPAGDTSADERPTHADPASSKHDPTVEELLGELRDNPPRPITPPPAPANGPRSRPGGESEDTGLIREGMSITSRRGRIERPTAGSPVFVSDSGASSPSADPPMTLLPCLNLEAMERTIAQLGDRAVFTVSGQVFVYEGRNYLLPTFFIIETDREGNLVPGH